MFHMKPLVRAAPGGNGRQGLGEDRDVEPDRPVLEVVEVETYEVVEAEVDAAGDLPKAGHSREDEVALPMPVVELDVVAQRQRARADERHLAAKHVEDLRQLVDRVPAQEAPDPRHTGVVLDLEERTRGLVDRLESRLPL